MKIGALKEGFAGEARVAITPSSATHLRKLGHEAFVESGAGAAAGFSALPASAWNRTPRR